MSSGKNLHGLPWRVVSNLFHSVNWISANFPNRLFKALQNSSTVITAWDKDELVGLVRVIDDTQMVAFIHYVLVNPKYQGLGIASKMLKMVKEKYQDLHFSIIYTYRVLVS
jgi:GNAT superfamily N-acetyltransferase